MTDSGASRRAASARTQDWLTRNLAYVRVPFVVVAFAALAPAYARAAGADLCKVADAATVGAALHATIVRAEAPESDPGCEYSVKDTPGNSSTNHAIAMGGAMGGAPMDPAAAKALSAFGNAVLGSSSAKEANSARHPGEVPALVFNVSTGDAQDEMKTNRDMMGRISPVTPVPGLGDEAFETSNSMLFVRKGDKFVRFIYTQCNCASKDVIALARRIVAGL